MSMDPKTCVECGITKIRDHDFYPSKGSRDGYRNTCKECHLSRVRRNQEARRNGLCPTCHQPKPSDQS